MRQGYSPWQSSKVPKRWRRFDSNAQEPSMDVVRKENSPHPSRISSLPQCAPRRVCGLTFRSVKLLEPVLLSRQTQALSDHVDEAA
jgi:hypothetical protein